MLRGALPTLFVSDMERAVAFYTEVLGLPLALSARGVEFGAVSSDGMLKIAHFTDPDGNPLYLCEQPSR